jgi:putative transposase
MAGNPFWDAEKLSSHAPRAGAREPALRQQLAVWTAREPRPRLREMDRIFWVLLSRLWTSWRQSLQLVRPETVVGWHRQGFRRYWTWNSRRRSGRPTISTQLRDLIRRISGANPLWGAPRIHGELLKLGLTVSQGTVSKYMLRPWRRPLQAWRTFLNNHAKDLIALDFFTVATATFRVLFVLVMLTPSRRRLVQFDVTEHPTAEWTARQLLEACGLEEGPVSDSGPRPSLKKAIFPSGQNAGHLGSGHCAPLAMAKRVRRAGDRLDSTGMP